MKYIRIVKTLAIAAVSSLTLIAGSSQAHDWGHFERANAPYSPERQRLDQSVFDHRGPGAFQQSDTRYNIDARQQQQMERIMLGLRSGQLTRHEARNLMFEQKQIEQLQREYLADNRLNRDEWLDLDRRLDRAALNIRAEKHDADWR
jgi:hypothetical protein